MLWAFPADSKTMRMGRQGKPRIGLLAIALLIGLVCAAGTSVAQAAPDPVTAQYCDGLGQTGTVGVDCNAVGGERDNGSRNPHKSSGGTKGVSASGGSVQSPSSSAGDLPFTGGDLLALSAVALSLLCGGLVLSRLTSSRRES